MKLLGALFAALALLVVALPAFAREVPSLGARVNDEARVLSPEQAARMERNLEAYEKKTGHQFVVLTIDTLDGDPLEDFSLRAVEKWKLGRKKVDDGLLVLVVKGDRKARIEVGYGLEGVITDATSSRIIRNVMVPAFRLGDYAGGLERALDALMRAGSGDGSPPPEAARQERRQPGGFFSLLFFMLLPFMVLMWLLRHFGGGGPGGFGGGRGWGGYGGWGGGGFGGSGGGGFGGGGGFSGGGGGFGGGGASGSW